jgi:outer membrane protein insertion porin family/translocation and assembly module TamA
VADVRVDLREDKMRQIDLQEGWATLDCFRLNSSYTDKNFRNVAQQLSLTGQLSKLGYAEHARTSFTRNLCDRHALDPDSIASQKVNDHFGATIRQPNVLGSHWSPSYSVYTERRGERQAYLRSTDLGFGINATRDIMPRTPLSLGYTFEHGSTHAENAILCGVFNRCTPQDQDDVQRSLPIAVASAALQRSTTDNQVIPTRGYTAGIEARYSAPWFASDPTQQFFKVTTDASWYRQLVRGVTFVGRVSGGVIRGGTEENGTRLPPPQERLYAGGAQSDRGFQQNELGPQVYLLDTAAFTKQPVITPGTNDTTAVNYVAKPGSRSFRSIPVGGNTSVVMNAELRLRDPFFPNFIEYVPFLDAGQVWTGQVGKSRFNLNDLQYTPGLSVRYFSPIGPIQGNLGYNPYGSRAGQAFFAAPIDPTTNKAPLICVTGPGEAPLPVTRVNGQLVQDLAACPNTYVPAPSPGIFSRLRFTLSINANF